MNVSKPKITAVIINFNGVDFLPQCLAALSRQSAENLHIIMVDNASTDNSVASTRQNFPQVTIIENNSNKGFSAAANQGISASDQTDYVLTLNPDVVLSDTFIATLVFSLSNTPRAGMASGKLVRTSPPNTTDSTGLFLLRSMHATDRDADAALQNSSNSTGFVFAPCGAAAIYKKTMLDDICYKKQYFDEDFFMYYEDADIAWRAQTMGWKCVFNPNATALHHRGASCPHKFRAKKTEFKYHCLKNRHLCMLKNMPVQTFVKFLPWIAAYELMIAGYCMLHPRLFAAHAHTIKHARKLFSFRKWLKARTKTDAAALEHYFKSSAKVLSKTAKTAK